MSGPIDDSIQLSLNEPLLLSELCLTHQSTQQGLVAHERQLSAGSCGTDCVQDTPLVANKPVPQVWQYVLVVIASMLNASVYSLLQIYSAYAAGVQKTFKLDEVQSNSLYSAANFGSCMFSWLPGLIFDSYGPVVTGSIGGVLICTGLGLCLLNEINGSGLVAGFFIFGLGTTFYNLNGVLSCLKCFPAEQAGAVSAVVLCALALAMTGHSLVYEAFFLNDFVGFLWYEIGCALAASLLAALVFGPLCGHLMDSEDADKADRISLGGSTPQLVLVSGGRSPLLSRQQSSGAVSPFRSPAVGPGASPVQQSSSFGDLAEMLPPAPPSPSRKVSFGNLALADYIEADAEPAFRGMVDSCPGTPGGRRSKVTTLNNFVEDIARRMIEGPSSMSRLAVGLKPSDNSLLNLARVEGSAIEIERAGPEDEAVRDLRRALRALLPEEQRSKVELGADVDAAKVPGAPSLRRSSSAPELSRERNFPGVPTFAEMAQPGAFRRDHLADEEISPSDEAGPAWTEAPPLTQHLATGHDFWARLSPQLPLKGLLFQRLRFFTNSHFIFLAIVFAGPIAWVFAYLGVVAGLGAKVGLGSTQVVHLTECLGVASAAGRLMLGVPPDFVHCVSREAFLLLAIVLMVVGTLCVLLQPSANSLWLCSNMVLFGYGGILALVPGCLRAGCGMRYVGFLYGLLYFLLALALIPWNSYAVQSTGCVDMRDCYGAWLEASVVSSLSVVLIGIFFVYYRETPSKE